MILTSYATWSNGGELAGQSAERRHIQQDEWIGFFRPSHNDRSSNVPTLLSSKLHNHLSIACLDAVPYPRRHSQFQAFPFSITTIINRTMKLASLLLAASFSFGAAWAPSGFAAPTRLSRTSLKMAIDYNDPVVAEEFAKVQPLTYEEVEEELQESGIRCSPTMNDMEVKLMLVEMRLRLAGKLAGDEPKKKPTTFSSKFEEYMWTKPAFEEFYNKLKEKDDHNAMNVVSEYVNDPATAKARYEKTYKGVLRQCEAAISAPPPVKSATIQFSGFPANMGEAGCKMTLESIGAVADFECSEDEDFPVLKGKVTFEDIESAKKAVAQYNGMDMGMGTSLELSSV